MSYGTPPPPPQYGGAPGAAASGSNSKAIWSLVTGILSLLCCGILGPVAIFLGRGAKAEQPTNGMATAGLVLGIIGTVFLVIQIILVATGNFYVNIGDN